MRSATWRAVCIGVVFVIAAVARSQVLSQPRRSTAQALFQRELAAVRRAGVPVSIHDIKAPGPPANRNAATYYLALGKHRISDSDWQAIERLYTTFAPTPAEVALARKLVAAHHTDIQLVHRAAACSRCVFPHDWSQWPVEMPPYAEVRQASRWLLAESALLWLDGKRVQAIRNQALGFTLARHAASDRSIISYLVAQAVDAMTLKGLERMLLGGGDQPGVGQAVRAVIQSTGALPSLSYAMAGEAANMLGVEGIDPDNPGHRYFRQHWQFGPLKNVAGPATMTAKQRRQWDEVLTQAACSLRLFRSVTPIMDGPFPQARARLQKVLHQNQATTSKVSADLAGIMGQTWLSVLARRAQSQARLEATRAAAGVLDYKAIHGGLPWTLSQAISPVPGDPFDLKPMRYRREGDGFVIYSVGETGKFNGGRADQKPRFTEAVFRWPKPAYIP